MGPICRSITDDLSVRKTTRKLFHMAAPSARLDLIPILAKRLDNN